MTLKVQFDSIYMKSKPEKANLKQGSQPWYN